MIKPEDCLGLVLAWTRTRKSLMVLQLIFAMTYTNLDDYLLFTKKDNCKDTKNSSNGQSANTQQ
jgi:hypothetical protein